MLTERAIQNFKPQSNTKRLFDAGGLYLEVSPSGSKWWRLKYRFNGKEKRLALGVFPRITLKEARAARDDARRMLDKGNDPAVARRAEKAARSGLDSESFEGVAREWYGKFSPNWAPTHADKILRRLERDVFPWLGSRPIGQVTAPELLTAARRIEARGALETAHRALQNCGQVFRYAVATGRAERNPVADLKGALPRSEGKASPITNRAQGHRCAAASRTWLPGPQRRPVAHLSWLRCYSCAPENCGGPSGRRLMLTRRSGASRRRR